jgi:hypothetical protein
MSFQNESNKTNTLPVGGALDPQDVQQPNASASRVVIRDKSSAEPHQIHTDQAFPIVERERITLQAGRRNNSGESIFLPIPDESSNRMNAHVDWLGVTVTPPEGKPIHWGFHEMQNAFGLSVTKIRDVGWNGYMHRADASRFGLVAWVARHNPARCILKSMAWTVRALKIGKKLNRGEIKIGQNHPRRSCSRGPRGKIFQHRTCIGMARPAAYLSGLVDSKRCAAERNSGNGRVGIFGDGETVRSPGTRAVCTTRVRGRSHAKWHKFGTIEIKKGSAFTLTL